MSKDKELRLSPSSINTYFRCPRLFWYNYIKKIRGPVNIHLYKGNFVHNAIDKMFESTKYIDTKKYVEEYMNKWNPSDKFFEIGEDREIHRAEAQMMLEKFAEHVDEKISATIMEKKVRGENHAWNRIKPRLREHRIKDEDLNILGIIDSVQTDFDERVYVIDYKTSKLYRETISSEYIRQVNLYAYLYYKEFGTFPDYVGINYLRYNELYFMPVEFVKDKIIESVQKDVKTIREHLAKSQNKEDYPMCSHEWCDCKPLEEQHG